MITSCTLRKRFYLAAISSMLSALTLFGAEPDAKNDTYPSVSSLRVDADESLTILHSTLLNNDSGDGIAFEEATSATSTAGAIVDDDTNSNSIIYEPQLVSQFIALDSGDNALDTFNYTIVGDDPPDTAGDEEATVTIRVDGVNDRPTLTNLNDASIDDDQTSTPFSGETIGDVDDGESLTVTVTADPAGDGSFTTLSGFTSLGGGQYRRTGGASTVTNALRALVYTPDENKYAVDSENVVTFTVLVDDGDLDVQKSLDLTVTSINDDPTITPTSLSTANLFSGAIITPFSEVELDDVDLVVPETNEGAAVGSDEFTATIVLAGGPNPGTVNSSNFTSTDGLTYTFTATEETLVEAINTVEYQAPGVTGTFTATLTVTDPNGGVSNELVFTAEVTAPISGVTGVIQDQQLADNGTITPFSTLVFNSFGSVDKLVTITLDDDAKGELELLGAFDKVGSTYTMTGDAIEATEAIQNIRFRPTPNRIVLGPTDTFEVTSFTINVGGVNVTSGEAIRVRVVPINDSPSIGGVVSVTRIDDDETVNPFASIEIGDADELGEQELTVTVSFIGEDVATGLPLAGGGDLAFGSFDSSPTDSITLTGTPSAVQADLRSLVFTPDPSRNPVGERETVVFTIAIDDENGGVALNNSTSVIVTSVNGAPLISGIPAPSQQPFPIAASADLLGVFTALPFERLSVDDEDDVTFTITMDPTKGTLSGTGLTDNGSGEYVIGPDAPADLTLDLQAIVFTSADPASDGVETTFTFSATDTINTVVRTFTITLRERNLSHIVSSISDSGAGSLREAIELAGNNDFIVFDFPNDDFPVTIELLSTLEIDKNLTIVGSGVQELTISGGDATSLFSVVESSQFVIERLTLKDGYSPSFGGAIAVDMGSSLIARYCSFDGNTAGQYGGAIDLFMGELLIENCLFVNNSVEGTTAVGGGALSIFTSGEVAVRNSTFYGNVQAYESGFGGGAIFAENAFASIPLDLLVEHCTFSDNRDVALKGSAILAKSSGLEVQVRNNIFAGLENPLDELDQPIPQAPVIDVFGGAATYLSLGGNIVTDETITTFATDPRDNKLLDESKDLLMTDPMILPLAYNGGITQTCDLESGSPAIDSSKVLAPTADSTAIDQRGYWRDGSPDIGAVEADSFERVQINEIFVNLNSGDTAFIEFYVPRDSVALNLEDIELYVDDVLGTVFGNTPLTAGAGTFWDASIPMNPERGTIELRDDLGRVLLSVDYVGSFAEQGNELDTLGQSMTRYALYEGGFLPHQRIVERVTGVSGGDGTSPGDDVTGGLLGGGNAPPIAVVDLDDNSLPLYAINADETLRPDILANDIEFDRADILKITEYNELVSGTTIVQELFDLDGSGAINYPELPLLLGVGPDDDVDSTYGVEQATITIDDDGLGLLYDPTASDDFIGLALGQTKPDIWSYTVLDFDAENPMSARSRGPLPSDQEENVERATSYFVVLVTGINEAPVANLDTASTTENQAIRLLADTDLLSPAPFNFGDLPADFQDFDSTGAQVTLLPAAPTISLLDNDDDVDSDDTNRTIRIVSVHQTSEPGTLFETTSELGARVYLDQRAERREISVLYDPRGSDILDELAAGEIATDRFFYSIIDAHGASDVGEVVITVTGVNDKPTATDDGGFIANEDEVLDISGNGLLENDTDPDQDGNSPDDMPVILTPFPTSSALGATLVFDGTTITYDPRSMDVYESLARNETIIDTFDYMIDDGEGGIDTATVTVLVEGENDAPVADDDALALFENDTVFVGSSDSNALLANDVDVDINNTVPDDDPWVIPQREVITPLGATLDIFPNGSYRYDANSRPIDSLFEGEITTEVFPYIVTDNFRTTASDDIFKVEGNRTDVVLPVLINDAVVGTATLPVVSYTEDTEDSSVVIVESPNHALRDGLLVQLQGYEGSGDYNGVHAIESVDRDHFSIAVPFEASAPTALGTWRPWVEITALTAGDQGGTLSSVDGQTVLYTPVADFYGTETFSYTIEDGVGGQDVATVEVEVLIKPFNGILDTKGETFRIGMGQEAVDVDVLANDNSLPAAGSVLNILSVTPTGGATGIAVPSAGNDSIIYTPPSPTFVGSETFEYTVSGGGTATSTAEVTFLVEDRTDLLSGSDDAFFIVSGSTDNLLPVLDNDANIPTFPVSSNLDSVSTPSSGGSAIVDGDEVRYTPPAAPFLGVETFEYTSKDASGASTTQTVRIEVVEDIIDFYAQADNYRILAGSDPILLPVLLNDGAVQNDNAVIEIWKLGLDTDSPPDVSRVAISDNGLFVIYTPPATPTTEDFNYEISIGTIDSREAKITIEVVDSFNLLPDAVDDAFSVEKNADPVNLNVLVNDLPYPDAGYTWTITAADSLASSGGTVAIDAGTSLTYTPVEGFVGVETFTYTIEDVFGASDTATVTVAVGALITTPDYYAVLENSSAISLPVLSNDDLLDRYATEYTINSVGVPSAGGAVSIDGTGPNNQILYTPALDTAGEEKFTYTVIDDTGAEVTETVTINIIDEDADRDTSNLTVTLTGINDITQIGGAPDGSTTDKESVNPFPTITITDLDEDDLQDQITVLTFDSSLGSISAPAFSQSAPGVYNMTGTPAEVQAALRAIVFTPFENVIDYIDWAADNSIGDLDFTLSLDDLNLGPVLGDSADAPVVDVVTINIRPINDDPFLVGNLADLFLKVNALPRAVLLTPYFDDVDDEVLGDEIIWTVSDNTNTSLFASTTIDPVSQLLVLTLAEDAFGVADITVRGTDRGGLFVEDTFTVTVDGPPVIELEPGQGNPDSPSFDSGSQVGSRRDYTQSFVVTNEGVLPADAFILNISGLETPVDGITLFSAKYSSDENGTPDIFGDDTRSSDGVTVLQPVPGTPEYSVKYDQPLAPGESVVVHLTYRASSLSRLTIEPIIEVELTTATPLGLDAPVTITMPDSETGEVGLGFTIEAGKSYIIQSTSELDGNWDTWALVLPISQFDRELAIIDDGLFTAPHPSLIPQRFYRIVEVID